MTKISNALSQIQGDAFAQKAAQYQTLYNNIKAEFQTRYTNSRTGALNVISQTAYLLALQNDLLADSAKTQNEVNLLVKKIEANGNKLSTGFVGTGILNQTLSAYGADSVAYNLLLQRENPSWLYSVDQGATTIWERWNSYTIASGFGDPGMNSFNHYSYGAVSEWMFRYMAGIEADESNPGFKHFVLQPTPDTRNVPEAQRITVVEAEFGSYYGKIKSKWERQSDGNYRYTITVPANTGATLYIPKCNGATRVYQNAVEAEKAEGVTAFANEKGRFVLELESGAYVFDTQNTGESGTVQVKKNDELKIYPNPVSKGEKIVVETDLVNENATLALYSLLGSLVANYPLKEKQNSIVINENSGAYLLSLRSNNETVKRSKLIVQ
jgi:alpha-L-rhamnosidase